MCCWCVANAHSFNEAVEQIAFADVVLLNKTDIVSTEEVKAYYCVFFVLLSICRCCAPQQNGQTVSSEEVKRRFIVFLLYY
jgi:G3E family GTPase